MGCQKTGWMIISKKKRNYHSFFDITICSSDSQVIDGDLNTLRMMVDGCLFVFHIVCGFANGVPWPEANAVWLALAWKSVGTPDI